MESGPKISTVEIILLVFVGLVADLLSIVPGLNILVAVIMGAITQFYFRIKKIHSSASLVTSLVELVPILSVLPVHLTGIILTIYIDRHPSGALTSAVENATKIKNAKGSLAQRAESATITAVAE